MSTMVTRALTLVGALLVLGGVNYAIVAKERIVRSGLTIYLELLPVDPRSLMQGDYMALRFRLADEIESARAAGSLAVDRFDAPIKVERGIASFDRAGAYRIRYRIRNGTVWLGTNAYFFEEGSAERHAGARFGEFKLDPDSGDAVLVALRGAELRAL
jgi:uncharacterized membrane-anchored protein